MEISILEMNLENMLKKDGLQMDNILMRMGTGKWLSTSSFTLDEVKNKNMEYTHVIWYNK